MAHVRSRSAIVARDSIRHLGHLVGEHVWHARVFSKVLGGPTLRCLCFGCEGKHYHAHAGFAAHGPPRSWGKREWLMDHRQVLSHAGLTAPEAVLEAGLWELSV